MYVLVSEIPIAPLVVVRLPTDTCLNEKGERVNDKINGESRCNKEEITEPPWKKWMISQRFWIYWMLLWNEIWRNGGEVSRGGGERGRRRQFKYRLLKNANGKREKRQILSRYYPKKCEEWRKRWSA